ncbi:hypothetical protein AXO1947_11060 [Xanthomonas oryzae pv. oryzae]|nr:hypothetical protein [Xanthomonas oryzae]ALS94975.1 hypothetical protein AXO1947_11060 [Xanthomonas oryzae pv. oryzae]
MQAVGQTHQREGRRERSRHPGIARIDEGDLVGALGNIQIDMRGPLRIGGNIDPRCRASRDMGLCRIDHAPE